MDKKNIKKHCEDTTEPDHRLVTWEKWVKVREKDGKKLAKRTQRPPADLAMHLVEDYRNVTERKTVLEYAQLEKKYCTIRGTDWEPPLRLSQECPDSNVYEILRTGAERGRPKLTSGRVGVPKYIQETEKGRSGEPQRVVCKKLDATCEEYWVKREDQLKERIKKIDPCKLCDKNLMVRGCRPKSPPPKRPLLPIFNIIAPPASSEPLAQVYAVRINNTVICKPNSKQNLNHLYDMQNESWHERCTHWSYYFNVPVKKAGRCTMTVDNLGTVAIRYCWKKVIYHIPYMPEEKCEQVFFFNKNEDVVCPGQRRAIDFTFLSGKEGTFCEAWELCPFVNIFPNTDGKLTVYLSGDSVGDIHKTLRKTMKLKTILERKAVSNYMKVLLYGILDNATALHPEGYPYKKMLLERDMFLSKNPICFYHQTTVNILKQAYEDMTSGKEWDLSISSWRAEMISKEFEERMERYDMLKECHRDLIRPWDETPDNYQEKLVIVKFFLGVLADKFDSEYDRLLQLTIDEVTTSGYSSHDDPVITLDDGCYKNVFYVLMRQHLEDTVDLCAGEIASLDLNRWIDFDFCQT